MLSRLSKSLTDRDMERLLDFALSCAIDVHFIEFDQYTAGGHSGESPLFSIHKLFLYTSVDLKVRYVYL